MLFPKLDDFDETLSSIHGYSKLLGAIRESFSPPHPRWWHISLKQYTSGITTANIPHPQSQENTFSLSLDLRNHYVLYSSSKGKVTQIKLTDALPLADLESQIIMLMKADGISKGFDNTKFLDHPIKSYSIDQAEKYFIAINQFQNIFEIIHDTLPEEKSPIQLWPHHFDFSFEQFGNFSIDYEEKGEKFSAQSQIGIGFVPFDDLMGGAYIYVNPYPFEEKITKSNLASGAYWYQENWNGAVLPYSEIVNTKKGAEKLIEFLKVAIKIQGASIER